MSCYRITATHLQRIYGSLWISWLLLLPLGLCQAIPDSSKRMSWTQKLKLYSERVNEAPTPPPKYLRRRWTWLQRQTQSSPDISDQTVPDLSDPHEHSLLTKLQAQFWSALGQASQSPLYESPQARNQRRSAMDLETRGTPLLPSYTHEFFPTVYPHKRMTSWNTVTEQGDIAVKIGGLTEIESIELRTLSSCLVGDLQSEPSAAAYLSLGEGLWANPKQLDINCLRDECLRQGTTCFVGIFSLKDWKDYTQPRGIASVSPEQSLLSLSPRTSIILSQDDAGNFYISASPDVPLGRLQHIAFMISAPRAYFSGSWRSSLSRSELKGHPNLELPTPLKRVALRLITQLFAVNKTTPFEEVIFKLTDYFRSFKPGEQPSGEGHVYERLMLSQIGVCRHRSYAFLITARALGIPTRYITNQVHAFAEVLDPSGRWRRVDLGGEGIAPEDHRLTQNLESDNNIKQPPFRPDDGLPRPPGYQHSLEQLNQQRRSLLDSAVSSDSTSLSSSSNDTTRSSNTPLTNDTRSHLDATSKEATPPTVESNNVDSLSPVSNQALKEPSVASTSKHDQDLSTQADQSKTASIDQNISESINVEHTESPKCAYTLSGPTRLSKRAQMLMLSSLRQRLGQNRHSLIQPTPIKITLRVKQSRVVHRCDLLTLKGRLRLKKKRDRSRLNGTWVLSAIKSKSDGKVLSGWGRVDMNGAFNFKAQLPAQVPPGDYQLFIYFPAQKGQPESWSELEN